MHAGERDYSFFSRVYRSHSLIDLFLTDKFAKGVRHDHRIGDMIESRTGYDDPVVWVLHLVTCVD